MQQSADMSGMPVIVLAQTAPIETQRRYRNMTNEVAEKFKTFGQAHIALGALCIIFQIVSLGFSSPGSGEGIWMGSLFVTTGAFGIFAGKKAGKCQRGSVVAMEAILSVLSVAEGIVAIYSSVTCCTIGVCCCKCGGSCPCCCPTDPQYHQFVNPVQPHLSQHQVMAANQQQPVFNPNQQQPMLNANLQQPVFNPNQQQPMLSPSQQLPVLNPKQQQPMLNLNQQQPMFIPNQQQLMFYPNQQQPMFFPNQSFNGFYPQQYAVQHHAQQPNVSPNPPQPTFSASLPETTGQGTHTIEYTGLTAAPPPTDISTQSSGDRSYEGLIRFSDSEISSPQEPPPPYDNDPEWNYSHI